MFDPHNTHRRKSSLVAAETPAHLRQRGKNTQCFVHALLENQRKSGGWIKGGLHGIAETLVGDAGEDSAITADGTLELEPQIDQEKLPEEIDADRAFPDQLGPLAQHVGDSAVDTKPDVQVGVESPPVHSRLLTKKQLSDMALGVRELSKRLASIRLKLKVKTVFLLTKAHDESLIGNTREVARWLLSPEREIPYTVYVEQKLKDNEMFNSQGLLKDLEKSHSRVDEAKAKGNDVSKRLKYWTDEMCRARPHTFDFIVTLGGDGTVLYASWLFQRIVPPVLSFSLGSLGFLTKFDYENFQETLTKSFLEGVTISLRLRFEGTVMRSQKRKPLAGNEQNGEEQAAEKKRDLVEELVGEETGDERTHRPDGTYEILNDIVVDRGPNPSMIFLHIIYVEYADLFSNVFN